MKAFLDTISPIAENKGVTLSQLVLRWTSLQPAITVVLAGARNADQAIANAQAIDIVITTEEMALINLALTKI